MNKVYIPALTQITYRQQTTTEITKVFADPPRADKDNSANLQGYGDLHQQLLAELKQKLKPID